MLFAFSIAKQLPEFFSRYKNSIIGNRTSSGTGTMEVPTPAGAGSDQPAADSGGTGPATTDSQSIESTDDVNGASGLPESIEEEQKGSTSMEDGVKLQPAIADKDTLGDDVAANTPVEASKDERTVADQAKGETLSVDYSELDKMLDGPRRKKHKADGELDSKSEHIDLNVSDAPLEVDKSATVIKAELTGNAVPRQETKNAALTDLTEATESILSAQIAPLDQQMDATISTKGPTLTTTMESTSRTSPSFGENVSETNEVPRDASKDSEVEQSSEPDGHDIEGKRDQYVQSMSAEKSDKGVEAGCNSMEIDDSKQTGNESTEQVVQESVEGPPPQLDAMNSRQQAAEKKNSKHVRSKNVDPNILKVRHKIQLACRDNDLESAMKVYESAVESDTRLEAQSFYNLLNLCDGLERTVHVGTPKVDGPSPNTTKASPTEASSIGNQKRQEYAFHIKDHMARLNLPLNEAAYTAITKVLVRNKEFAKAEEVLDESEAVQQCKPRLRLYSSLLAAYCEERYMVEALKCWLRIINQQLVLTEREFLNLMKCAIATGDVLVYERILSDIAETVPVPSKETVSSVLEWFQSPHAVVHSDAIRVPKHANESEVKTLLDTIQKGEVESPPSMAPVQDTKGWKISSAVPIDTETGTLKEGCLGGTTLKPVALSERAWEEMTSMNKTIVLEGQLEGNASVFQGGRKGKLRNDFDPEERNRQWKHFTDFLESKGPIDVVIDAANVGYFKQNFATAPKHVDYQQIDWVVRRFIAMDKKVLLFLHQRHFSQNLMPKQYLPLQREWERQGILYKTPAGMNDDWFWLHAALQHRALVLTNDEMRDHHFQMLAPRNFLRWKERHQVHFSFGEWELDDKGRAIADARGRQVELEFPAVYSRRVQRVENGLVVPLIKRGDENRFLDGTHVADHDEPAEETYLCIRAMK